jgi:hypothetical protein
MCSQGKYTAFILNFNHIKYPKYNALETNAANTASETEKKEYAGNVAPQVRDRIAR